MSNLLNDLFENIGDSTFQKIGDSVNIQKDKRSDLAKNAIGVLFGQISKNSQNKNESEKIIKVLKNDHQNNLENVENILNGSLNKNGIGILKHILGKDKDIVIDKFAKMEKIEKKQAGSLLEKVAPIFMGSLSKTVTKTNMDGSVLANVLKMAIETDFKNNGILSILDFDKDGQIVDDIPAIFSWLKKIFFGKK